MGFDINRSAIRSRPQVGFSNPGGSPRHRPQADQRLADCKICWEGLFQSESRIWATLILPSRRMGLVHVGCAIRTKTPTAGEPTTGGQRKYRT